MLILGIAMAVMACVAIGIALVGVPDDLYDIEDEGTGYEEPD